MQGPGWSWQRGGEMATYLVILFSRIVIGGLADSHTLRYYYTGVSEKGSGLPEFSMVGYVDEREFINYNSESHQARPVTSWMEKNEGPQYWDRETQNNKGGEPVFRHNVRTAMSRFNQTAGLHVFQWMYGCEVRDDGSTAGYQQYGYDGRDFAYVDTQSWMWIPSMHEAQITTQRWNSPEERDGERQKNYLDNICIDSLRKYVQYGRQDLERRVRPEVKVWGRQSGGETKLHCLVYGFHPRAVDVKWVRNDVDEVLSLEAKTILPHPDGTYQIRISVEVPISEEDSYFCHVDHSSLEDIARVKWEPDNGRQSNVIVIIAVIAGLAALTAVIAGVAFYIRKRDKKPTDYQATRTSESSSDNNPTA